MKILRRILPKGTFVLFHRSYSGYEVAITEYPCDVTKNTYEYQITPDQRKLFNRRNLQYVADIILDADSIVTFDPKDVIERI